MNHFGKKFVALALAGSIFASSSVVAPKRSQASFGLLVATVGANPALSVVFFLGAVGAGTQAVSFFKKGWRSNGGTAFINYFLSLVCLIATQTLLDGTEAQSAELKSLSPDHAQRFGITEAEWRSYEAELPLVNALREEAMARTEAAFQGLEPTTPPDLEKVALTLRSNWKSLSDGVLAPETLATIQKLGQAIPKN